MQCVLNKKDGYYIKEDMVASFKQIHGDKYDYSLIQEKVKSKKEKLPIICHQKNILGEEHGIFYQTLERHLNGRNCPKCIHKNSIRSDEEIFALAKSCHDELYEYKEIIREKGKEPMIRGFCHHTDENGNEHGEFVQSIYHHINEKQSCPKCRYVKSAASKRRSLEDIIKIANKIHENKYDYSLITEYKNDRTKYPIRCKKHDIIFSQTMNNHLIFKEGCPICAKEQNAENRKYTNEEWIAKAREIHGDKYEYKEEYKGSRIPIEIICPIHGAFRQFPSNHLFGQGCPICKESKLEREMRFILSENNIKFISQHTFDWLIYKRNMFLDFYLPEYNIAIECQGKQHFRNGGWTDSIEDFEEIETRDSIKRQLCEEHNIKLLYFSNLGIEYPYKVYEDVNELLTEVRNGKNK